MLPNRPQFLYLKALSLIENYCSCFSLSLRCCYPLCHLTIVHNSFIAWYQSYEISIKSIAFFTHIQLNIVWIANNFFLFPISILPSYEEHFPNNHILSHLNYHLGRSRELHLKEGRLMALIATIISPIIYQLLKESI